MEKIHKNRKWENLPSMATKINAQTLNEMEAEWDAIDDRVIEIAEKVAAKSDVTLNRQTLGYTKKNLLKINSKSGTSNGITYDSDTDTGVITLNGTATSMVYIWFSQKFCLKAGTYILSGCPTGGRVDGTSYYRQNLVMAEADGTWIGDWNDYGGDSKITVTKEQEDRGVYFQYMVVVWTGYTAENLTFYPMLRSADITDDTYEPYVDDVDTRLKALKPVANLVTTVAGKPLDAVIGKELADMIAAIPTITFATEEPDSVPENTIVMVYEE